MTARALSLGLAIGLSLIAGFTADAQQAAKVARVGYVATVSQPNAGFDAFRQGLREVGWFEGQNVVFEYRWGNVDRNSALMAELVSLKLDVIVVSALSAAAAKDAARAIPVVFVTGDDPVATGLVASLARPGGNMTGVTSLNVELDGKRFDLLKQTIPRLTRVAVLFNPDHPGAEQARAALERTARSAGVALQIVDAREPGELEGAIATATRGRAQALAVYASPLFYNNQLRIAQLSSSARLPAIAAWTKFPESGGLMSYGVDIPVMYGRAAGQVDKILRGARPAELPVERATTIGCVINLNTARTLGLTIPQSVRSLADHLIQ